MLLSAKRALPLTVVASGLVLSGCSAVMPMKYQDYTGPDAATLIVQHRENWPKTIYMAYYVKKGDCFDRDERYQLNPTSFENADRVLTFKIPPGKFIAIQQIYTVKKQLAPLLPFSDVTEAQWIPFIPQPGKRYYFAIDYRVREISANYFITNQTKSSDVVSAFPQTPQPNWDVTKRCRHIIKDE